MSITYITSSRRITFIHHYFIQEKLNHLLESVHVHFKDTFLRSGWSVERSASLAKGGTSKRDHHGTSISSNSE
jgi:hypothetical protein